MPQLLVAAAAAAAAWGASALAVSSGIALAGSFAATLIGSAVGLLVSVAGSMLISALTPKPKVPDLSQDRKQAVRSAIEPHRVVYGRSLVSGPVLYIGSSGSQNEFFHVIVALAGHEVEDIEELYINEHVITLAAPGVGGMGGLDRAGGALSNTIRIHTYDGSQTAADPSLVSECASDWTNDHVLQGIAYVYCRLSFNQDIYPSGFSSIAAVVKGKKVYDPRDDSTAWSDNAALCIRDYLTAGYGMSCAGDEIDDPYFESAANICDETVYVDVAETIPQIRYDLNGSFKLDMAPLDIMERLLSACGGALIYIEGAYRLHVSAYDAPAVTLTVSDFAGPLKVVSRTPRQDVFNQVVGTYINPDQKWTAVSFPIVSVSDFVTEDGQAIQRDVEFPFTTNRARVQRLARIELLRARRPITIEAPFKYSTLRVAAWDTVAITMADLGWTEKAFRVKSWKFDPVSGLVNMKMQEEYATSYSWTALDAGPDLSTPEPTLVNALDIPAPSTPTLTPTTVINADGATVPALLVEWTLAAHPFVTATEIQWKVSTDPAWSSRQIAQPTEQMIITAVVSGLTYQVRARSVAGLVRSAWTSAASDDGGADTTAPSVPGSPAAAAISTGILLTWTKPPQSDFVAVEIWENTTNNSGTRYYLGNATGASYLRAGLGGGQLRYYWLRSYDRTGNYSAYTSVVSATSTTIGTGDVNVGAITKLHSVKATDAITLDDGTIYAVMSLTVVVPDTAGRVKFDYTVDLYQSGLPGSSGTSGDGGEGSAEG